MIGAYTDLTTKTTWFIMADGEIRGYKPADFCFYMSGPIESFQQDEMPRL